MSASAIYEGSEIEGKSRKIIIPKRPHKTSLEVEEIGSHRFPQDAALYLSDVLRLGNHGKIEEPEDSDVESIYKEGKKTNFQNRGISIVSLSEDESTIVSGNLSRDMSLNDFSKCFDSEDMKFSSKKNYSRQASYQEDQFSINRNVEDTKLSEKRNKMSDAAYFNNKYENSIFAKNNIDRLRVRDFDSYKTPKSNDITDKYFGNNKCQKSTFDILKKNSNVGASKKVSQLDEDPCMEDLLKRINIQRAALGDILKKEGERSNQGKLKNKSLIY